MPTSKPLSREEKIAELTRRFGRIRFRRKWYLGNKREELILSDILAAINCKTKLPTAVVLNKTKKLIIDLGDVGIAWDLSKPLFTDQSPETQDQIISILLNEEK